MEKSSWKDVKKLGVLVMALVCCSASVLRGIAAADPTHGFTQVAFTCKIQKPYNIALADRFHFSNGTYDFWVYRDDKPFQKDNPTKPRTELRVEGLDYTTGVWQFVGDLYVASTTTGVCVMQIFGGNGVASTALQLRVIEGNLVRYGGGVSHAQVATNISNQWIHLNIIHDADGGSIQIYINNVLKHSEENSSYENHYFKCGVYTQANPSSRMESKWRNVEIWKRSAPAASLQALLSTRSCLSG